MSRDVALLTPVLRDLIPDIEATYARIVAGYRLLVIRTLSTADEQRDLYEIGRAIPPIGEKYTVTDKDGYYKLSFHQAGPDGFSRAVDFCVLAGGGKAVWDPALYSPLGPMAERRGLSWGGSWTHRKDWGHLETMP